MVYHRHAIGVFCLSITLIAMSSALGVIYARYLMGGGITAYNIDILPSMNLPMTWWQAILLVIGGLIAGVINTMAGGGSTLTVPLLTLAGVPGNEANGSNRVGILTSSLAATAAFRKLGFDGISHAGPIIWPALMGSLIGSYFINQLTDDSFETAFGLLMIPIALLTIVKPKARKYNGTWSVWVTMTVFFGVGLYGGAIQAGVGLVLLAAISRAGFNLIMANSIKVLVNFSITCIALPVFIWQGNVRWMAALILALGLTMGGYIGARFTVEGGEKWIRIVAVLATLGLAGKLLGLYG